MIPVVHAPPFNAHALREPGEANLSLTRGLFVMHDHEAGAKEAEGLEFSGTALERLEFGPTAAVAPGFG